MNDVIKEIEELEKEITLIDQGVWHSQRGQFYLARAILKLALVHAGNNVEDVAEVRKEEKL